MWREGGAGLAIRAQACAAVAQDLSRQGGDSMSEHTRALLSGISLSLIHHSGIYPIGRKNSLGHHKHTNAARLMTVQPVCGP